MRGAIHRVARPSIQLSRQLHEGSAINSRNFIRPIHASPSHSATPLPVTAAGHPPAAPVPSASHYGERIDQRRRKAEMLKQAKDLRSSQQQPGKASPLRKRFWKEVHVKPTPDGYHILLDARPVRTPKKAPLEIPLSKPHLAHAIAMEWDSLVSAQQALKNHHIPLTSIASRAQDILDADEQRLSSSPTASTTTTTPEGAAAAIREDIVRVMMRYLDTDTLICWAPTETSHDASQTEHHTSRTSSLREIQQQCAAPILAHLRTAVWPGVEIRPVLDDNTIVPAKQPELTRSVIRAWIAALPAYELAALERGVFASKSLLVAARLLVEWSEEFRPLQRQRHDQAQHQPKFGIEEAAQAASLEVTWQTRMWGEVEDTHDVDREDLRQQLGSVVLLVSGNR